MLIQLGYTVNRTNGLSLSLVCLEQQEPIRGIWSSMSQLLPHAANLIAIPMSRSSTSRLDFSEQLASSHEP